MIEMQFLNQMLREKEELRDMKRSKPIFWSNPQLQRQQPKQDGFTFDDMLEAEQRLRRFSSYIRVAFPETEKSCGIIESEIKEIPHMKQSIESEFSIAVAGRLFLKCDHALPISGSIKARGGIYEVLKYAEQLALDRGLIQLGDDYSRFNEKSFYQFFRQYKLAVGSTGNLGLSIGIVGAKLGFQVTVHMSSDAKEWKKQLLREKGVEVIEYASDYSKAVEAGRKQADLDPMCHFIDDENSKDLFAGYSTSALRVEKQLEKMHVAVDEAHPLFVYLPCGVGGGPGGVAFGLKQLYGEHVHIFFGEPTQSPCMMLGMMTGLHDGISVQDLGLQNQTEADGLAVGRASRFVGKMMEPVLSGCYTVEDSFLFRSLSLMMDKEGIFMEPSAHAGVFGAITLLKEGAAYIEEHNLKMDNATHLVWSTGGNMVPEKERERMLKKEF